MRRQLLSDIEYLAKLQDYYAKHQVFPTYAAIGKFLGLKSTSSVSSLLHRLKKDGFIDAVGRRLRPGARFLERKLMQSQVAAGLPEIVFDAPLEGLTIDSHLITRPSRSFLINVKGDSMIDAGLMPGDTIIVERDHAAKDGDIVVAFIDDAYTVKRLKREGKKFILKPENKAYPVLRPDPIEIAGVVVGSFRKYR